MGRGTLLEVQYELGDLRVGPERVLRHAGRSETGRETLGEVLDGSGYPVGARWEVLYGSGGPLGGP